ncbi:hypothetical protein LTR53_007960 [Teratosphaeriaceae sp. CCFEE 6253]|nr:hypothetical protein LTR53_007960 [Teratosphaeriaceae sp. CCFEE 6253]
MSSAPKKNGLSLYANLLAPDPQQPGATIAGAPVRYDTTKRAGADEEKRKDAALQFAPVRRPQGKVNRPTAKKGGGGSGHAFSSSTTTASLAPSASSPDKQTLLVTSTPSVPRSNFEDWVGGDDEEDDFYLDNKPRPERGGRKNKKKKGKVQEAVREWSWDDIYDPSMPNSYADYKGSEEQVMEIRDWKARLYYHQIKAARKNGAPRNEEVEARPLANSMFAPPASLSFAPPSFNDAPSKPPNMDDEDDEYYPPSEPARLPDTSDSYEPPPAFSQAFIPDDPTGEDAYMRRMQFGGAGPPMPPPAMLMPLPLPPQHVLPPPIRTPAAAPVLDETAAAEIEAKKAQAAAKIAEFKAMMEAKKAANAGNGAPAPSAALVAPAEITPAAAPPPAGSESASAQAQPAPPPPPPVEGPEPNGMISRAPVRYQLPAASTLTDTFLANSAPSEDAPEEEEEEAARSNRPGQKGFAERLLKKYGWEKGKGLGASGNEGITTAIVAKAEKRKKLADAQGGGWKTPGNMGKLVGGKRRKVEVGEGTADGSEGADGAEQPFGPLSDVIKLEGMLTGLDIDDEIQNKDLYGEIGREMEGQYGKVERVFIWRAGAANGPDGDDGETEVVGGDEVFVKFVSPLSALRAVGACDGMEFADNVVKARFWEGEKFGRGVFA